MKSMDINTGQHITGNDARHQAVFDVLLTPIKSVVMHRDYGSFLPDLIAKPQNEHTNQLLRAATATALMLNLPQFKQSIVSFSDVTLDGQRKISIEGTWNDQALNIQGSL